MYSLFILIGIGLLYMSKAFADALESPLIVGMLATVVFFLIILGIPALAARLFGIAGMCVVCLGFFDWVYLSVIIKSLKMAYRKPKVEWDIASIPEPTNEQLKSYVDKNMHYKRIANGGWSDRVYMWKIEQSVIRDEEEIRRQNKGLI